MNTTNLTSVQKKALKYKNEAVSVIPTLKPFYLGRVPCLEHYKRLTLDETKALEIASYGYLIALKELGVKLYFTQSLIVGCAILGTHHKILTVLPSQYGKSFLSAVIGLLLAYNGEPISVSANDKDLTQKIMSEVWRILPNTPESFKKKLITPLDKFERTQTSLSKNKVGFVGGGYIEGITLGGKFSDSLSGNKAVGQSGNFIIDESALIPDSNYAETGRSEVAYRKDGKPYLSMEMSNPHQINHFYRDMIQDPVDKGTLVVWADLRISIEEGKQVFFDTDPNKPKFEETKFFKNESVCRSYYLCDFGNVTDGSFFTTSFTVDDSPIPDEGEYILGLDSANRGSDSIMGTLIRVPDEQCNKLRVVSVTNFKPNTWEDFKTPQMIEDLIVIMLKKFNIKVVVMDLGGGEYLYDRLGNRIEQEGLETILKGVYFNNSPTKERIREDYDISDGSANGAELAVNKRAEMYLDLRDLVEKVAITFKQKVYDLVKDEVNATGKEIYTSRSKIQIEEKKIIKKKLGHSPDTLDSIALGVHGFVLYALDLLGGYDLRFYP